MQFFTTLLSVLSLAVSTTATFPHVAERSIGKRLDVTVSITQPAGGEIYYIGSTQTSCWLTENIPSSAVNETGSLLIGFLYPGTNAENIYSDKPLYSGFLLIAGCVNYVVPDITDVNTGNEYFLVVDGESGLGNRSGLFAIVPPLKS